MVTISNRAIVKRIHEALERKGLSAQRASISAGLGRDAIRNLERDAKILPRIDTLEKLAPVLDLEPQELAGWSAPDVARSPVKPARVIGEVAAGLWHEIDGAEEGRFDDLAVPYDQRYPREAQYGLVVRGTSVNRVAQPGDVLLCIDLGLGGLEPKHQDLVIVERRRAQAGQKEVTAKRYRATGRKVELLPDSDDPRWKKIVLDPKHAPDDEEIAIVAIVIGIYKPLRRS